MRRFTSLACALLTILAGTLLITTPAARATAPASTLTWTTKAPMPSARYGLGVAAASGRIYAIGGHPAKTAVEEYDPATNTWTTKASMPTPRHLLAAATATNGKVYAVGGELTGATEEYDAASNTWTVKASMPTARQNLGLAAATNGRLYAVGGGANPGSAMAVVEEYNPATNIWTTKAPMPTARYAVAAVGAPNSRIYAIGGRNTTGFLNTVEEYDPATNSWTAKAGMLTARQGPAAVVGGNGKIYAIGGWDASGALTATAEEYDPATDMWTSVSPLSAPRSYLGAAAVGPKLYAIGGFGTNNDGVDTVEEATLPAGAPPPPPPNEPPPGPPDGVCPRPDGAVFPPNGGTIEDSTPTFVFHGVVGHNLYRAQVATENTFAQPIADSGGFTGDYALTTPLDPGTYYWRVACRTNENVWRPWGAPWSFTLVAPPPPNQPPTASAGGPYSVPEGGSVTLAGSGSDPDGDALTYAWDLDNNSSFETAGQSPTLSAAGRDGPSSQTIVLQVCDGSGACATSSTTVSITNVAPTATFNAPASVDEGSPFTISLGAPVEPSPADVAAGLTYAFDCGAGYGAYGAASSVSCPTTDNGTRTVKGKIRDKDGGESEYTASVTVNNVAPAIQSVANSGPISEGGSATITVTASDPAGPADPLVLRADCNSDGSFETIPVEMVALQLVSTASLPCAFQDNGTFQVSVQVSDGDGGVATAATTVVVNNVAPTAVLANSGPISEGGAATISFSSQFDPSPVDTAAGFRYAYDCNSGSLAAATYGSSSASASTTCSYADNGSYTVRARIVDKDGGYTEYTTAVTVNNVAPTVSAGADVVLYSGQSLSLSAGFTDPGINDAPWTYTIDWGDSASGNGSTGTQGAGVITGAHQYFVPGTYTVKVCVTDKDNGKGCDDLTVEVKRLVVRIDVKPGSDPNSINLRSRGNVPVGILDGTYSGVALDATTIVRSTVVFAGAAALTIGGSPQDVNGDGRLDVVYHFDTQALSLTRGSTQGCLTGRTSGNIYFEGCDSVRIVP